MNETKPFEQQAQPAQAGIRCCNQATNKASLGWRNQRTLAVATATAVVGSGLALNWEWLVAVGIAPLILSVLPCLVMCALGLCASKLFGGSANSKTQPGNGTASETSVTK